MKKKAVVLLLGGTMALMMIGNVAQAQTYGYSWAGDDGEIRYYERKENEKAQESLEGSAEVSSEASSGEGTDTEVQKKYSDYHKAEMQEELSYLEKYGVVYDAEKDLILYEGKKVRWLIDNQIDDLYRAFEMPDGEIDLYTVRGSDYQVTGVRVATQEEYDERTRMDEEIQKDKMNEVSVTLVSPSEEPFSGSVLHEIVEEGGTVSYRISEDAASDAKTDSLEIIEGSSEAAGDYSADAWEDSEVLEFYITENEESGMAGTRDGKETIDSVYESSTAIAYLTDEEIKEHQEKVREYGNVGIENEERTGAWLWNGKPVYWLIDDDGSMHQNGSKEAKEQKIYLIVKRDDEGNIQEVRQVTIEELAAEIIMKDAEKEGTVSGQ